MQSVTQTHHYDIHVFCCINERAPGHPRGSCSARGAQALQAYMKAQGKALGLGSRVRMNKSGCLERCELGPTMVIYPEGVWYTYNSEADIDEILHRHVLGQQAQESWQGTLRHNGSPLFSRSSRLEHHSEVC